MNASRRTGLAALCWIGLWSAACASDTDAGAQSTDGSTPLAANGIAAGSAARVASGAGNTGSAVAGAPGAGPAGSVPGGASSAAGVSGGLGAVPGANGAGTGASANTAGGAAADGGNSGSATAPTTAGSAGSGAAGAAASTSGAAASGAAAPGAAGAAASTASGAAASGAAASGASGAGAAGSAASGAAASGAGTAANGGSAGAAATSSGAGTTANGGSAGTGGAAASGAPGNGAAGSSPAAGSGALPPAPTPARPAWTRCGSYQCATLEVPLDYAAPSGEKIKLALKRRVARGQRIGSLLINPGGPGGSGVEFLSSFVQVAGSALLSRFDIVAFDPRGVGASTPIECHSNIQKLIAADPSPDDEAEWQASAADAKAFADECGQKYGKLLPHLGTVNVARDMDQIRAALGDEKLSYLGFSYGTAIGARYADLFPERVRALVLDGALDMSLSALDVSLQQAQGFEAALATYFEWCELAANNCGWRGSMQPKEAFAQLASSVEQRPLSGRVPVGPGEFLLGVIAPLYGGEDGYRILSQALTGAARGDGSTIMTLVDGYTDRRPDGTYGNIQEANNAVNCIDMPTPDYAGLRAEEMRFSMAAPIFGTATLTSLMVCAHWPVRTQQAPTPKASGAAPILVVGTTGDPATPYRWAEALADQLESGVLLTFEGEGHTAYSRGTACIDDAVEAYLIDTKVPENGKRCGGGSAAPSRLLLPARPFR